MNYAALTHFFLCRFREDAAALKAAWDAQIAQMSKEAVSKDLQIQALQEEEMKLKAQVAKSQQDIDRYCPQGSSHLCCFLQTRTITGPRE